MSVGLTDQMPLARLLLIQEVTELLNAESSFLDNRDYDGWLDLLTDDIRYWMPVRKNLALKDMHRDAANDRDIAWIDDDKETLTKRVRQIQTGVHWIEEPVSRVAHMVSNIRVPMEAADIAEGEALTITSHVLVYQNRLETETDLFVARRVDSIRREGGALRIASRKILLEQSVMMAKALTVFL